jgi:segregation and condensation protein B
MTPDDHDDHDALVDAADAGEPTETGPLTAQLEALLLAAERPLSDGKLGELLDLKADGRAALIEEAIAELNASYAQTGRTFRAERRAGGWQLLTEARFAPLVAQLTAQRQQSKLSHAALESLSIIAYRQPVMRAEVEAIRGVASGEVLRGLLDRRLVKIVGRAEELGRPMLYGTTREFLNVFGLAGLDDLPEVEGLKRAPSYRPPAPKPAEASDDAGPEEQDEVASRELTSDDAHTGETATPPSATPVPVEDDAGEPPVAEAPARGTADAAYDA